MPINYRIDVKDDILTVKSTGICENIDQLTEYVLAIHEATTSTGQTKVLVDESELDCNLSIMETFQSGCFLAEIASDEVRIAVLCKSDGLEQT